MIRRLIVSSILALGLFAIPFYHGFLVRAPHPAVVYADDGQGDSPLVP